MRNHKDLIVWQKSVFPARMRLRACFQKMKTLKTRGAAVSILSGIAEGVGGGSGLECFPYTSSDSASERKTQMLLPKAECYENRVNL